MLKSYSRLVVIEHSVFALPFALASLILAVRKGILAHYDNPGLMVVLVLCAIILARTAAMAFNRFIDADIDAANPRTADREIPKGVLSRAQALGLTVICSFGFCGAAYGIGRHCFVLSPFVIGLLLFYSYTKRFTVLAHFVLGLCLAAAPGGAWWVIRPEVELQPILIMSAVMLWVAGFDILYSCQDFEFDRSYGLKSLPAKFGVKGAFKIALFCHVVASVLFALLAVEARLGAPYLFGLVPFIGLLLGQHRKLWSRGIGEINRRFFTYNGIASIYYLCLILLVQ